MRWEAKRPNEVRDYSHDWAGWLDGDTIVAGASNGTGTSGQSTVTVAGVTLDSVVYTSTTVKVWLAAGTAGTTATVTMTIKTAGGRTETEVFTLAITTADEPLTLSDVKAQLNIAESDTTYDALLQAYIPAAREYVENRSDHIIVQRSFTEYRSSFGRFIELTRRPLVSVTEVGYVDTDGADQVYADFVASLDRLPGRVYADLDGWFPAIQTNTNVSVTYVAGYAPGTEPAGLLHAMRMLLAHWFNAREAVNIGNIVSEIPHGVDALCDQLRGALL